VLYNKFFDKQAADAEGTAWCRTNEHSCRGSRHDLFGRVVQRHHRYGRLSEDAGVIADGEIRYGCQRPHQFRRLCVYTDKARSSPDSPLSQSHIGDRH
jgi:hypothetical protein